MEALDILSCTLQRVTYLGSTTYAVFFQKVQITAAMLVYCWSMTFIPPKHNSQMEPGADLISANGIVCALQLHIAKAYLTVCVLSVTTVIVMCVHHFLFTVYFFSFMCLVLPNR